MTNEIKSVDGLTLGAHRTEGLILIDSNGSYWTIVGPDYLEARDNELARAWEQAIES